MNKDWLLFYVVYCVVIVQKSAHNSGKLANGENRGEKTEDMVFFFQFISLSLSLRLSLFSYPAILTKNISENA